MPEADVEVTHDGVRALLRAQHPDLAELQISPLARGWDNELFRLGDELLVRLPRRASASALMQNELRWLATIAPSCSLPVPVPRRRGEPAEGYPYAWSIVPYLPGRSVGDAMLDAEGARVLGAFVRGLHVPSPDGAPRNPLRGVPLVDRQGRFDTAIVALADRIDTVRIREVWARCVAAPPWQGPPVWLHGDLHPFNVLWDGRALCGVIDFGDLAAGDPAVDLAIAFMCFADAERQVFLDASGADPATILRGRGWAIALGSLFAASEDPVLAPLGMRALA